MRRSIVAVLSAVCLAPLMSGAPAYADDPTTPAIIEGESEYADLGVPLGIAADGAAAAALPKPRTPNFGPAIDRYAVNDPQSTCPSPLTERPGPVALRALLNDTYNLENKGNITRPCNQGKKSEHKEGRALDYMLNINNDHQRDIAETVLDWMLEPDAHGNKHAVARRWGIMYIIWNRKIWASYYPDDGWRTYLGDNPHTDHIHFSFSRDGGEKRTSWWDGAAQNYDSFSGDARADMVVHSGTEVSVRQNVGGFDAGQSVSTGWGRYHGLGLPDGMGRLYYADFNGDHLTDMIVHTGTDVSVRLNKGGWFDTGRSVSSGWGRFHGLDVPDGMGRLYFADYNGDGRADMIVHSGTDVSVRLNEDGTHFGTGRSVSSGWGRFHGLGLPDGMGRLYFADYNGDGRDDMIVHTGTDVSVRLNQVGGGFDSGRSVSSGWGRFHGLGLPDGMGRLYFADYDGDGFDDMIVHSGTEVSVRLNDDGDGFDTGRSLSTGWGRFHGLGLPDGMGRLYFA
ncbi:VCBS repeat-containing protein [Actinoplanes sp. NPDC051861]|uniref:FG-GAP repeat domain-containing protein n=1 Tax=Actinoplanes sp. NPDC051861 TaxID=3155170 RepID=UPI00343B8675